MGHLPVIGQTWRATFEFNELQGVKPRNVMHFFDSVGGATPADVFNAIQGAIPNPGIFQPLKSGFICQTVSLIHLDGTSGSTAHNTDGSSKWEGFTSGDPIPNLAAVVKLATGLRGREHRGRVFLGPIGESANDGGMLTGSWAADTTTNWVTFTNALITAGFPLVVASYKHSSQSPVDNVRCRNRCGSVNRRLKQIALS